MLYYEKKDTLKRSMVNGTAEAIKYTAQSE